MSQRISQGLLMERIEKLGYKINPTGMCFGIAAMAMQATLAKDLETFNRRIIYVTNLSSDLLLKLLNNINQRLILGAEIETMNQLLQKRYPNFDLQKDVHWSLILDADIDARRNIREKIRAAIRLLTAEERSQVVELYRSHIKNQTSLFTYQKDLLQLNIPAFFEGIVLHQTPREYPFLRETPSDFQNITLSVPLTMSHKLEEAGGIERVAKFNGAYSKQELQILFDSLRRKIDQTNPPAAVSLVLGNAVHAISVGYDPEVKQFIFTDANILPAEYINDSAILAEQMMRSFSKNRDNPSDYIVFSSEAFVTKKNNGQVKTLISSWQSDPEWQNIHKVTKENAKRVDSFNASRLLIATREGDIDTVKAFINAGVDLNVLMGPYQKSALYVAADYGHTEIVKLLLHANVNLNIGLKSLETPLHVASSRKNKEIVSLLLEAKADPNIMTMDDHFTPLSVAVMQDSNEVVDTLLKAGANPNFGMLTGDRFTPPIVHAVSQQNIPIVKSLLNANATAYVIVPIKIKEVLDLARKGGIEEKLESFLQIRPDTDQNKLLNDCTLLHAAIILGNNEMVNLLVNNNANWSAQWCGVNALEFAQNLGRDDIVKTIKQYQTMQTAQTLVSFFKAAQSDDKFSKITDDKLITNPKTGLRK